MRLRLHAAAFLALPAILAAQTAPQLIPVPREYHAHPDQPLPNGVQITCNGCDADDQFAANDLRETLTQRGLSTDRAAGLHIFLQRRDDVSLTGADKLEGYTIATAATGLYLTGATASGVFYAAQTAKQMIEDTGGGQFVLHAADIRDSPAMKVRGLSDDLSRGPVDTLDFQKKIVRTLAAYKANLYSPYFENTQQYASNPLPAPPGGSISAADARELVAYAKQYHVDIVPDQEAFGHLRHALVYEQYQALAETPHGAVLAPGQPGSLTLISQMFGELAQLYPSPYLHVGADETEDLGRGQTKNAVDKDGLGKVYLDFMQQIDNTLHPLNRKLLFWGDIAQHEPDLLKAMPPEFKHDTIAIGWQYNPSPTGFIKYMKPYTDAGFETWVSPGINNWSRIYPNYTYGLENIQQFTRDGQTMGSTGQLNTIWYDDGEALASNNWYGIVFGAAAAWQKGESSIPQFESTYAQVFHGDRTGKLNEAQMELMAAHNLLKSVKLGDGSDSLFWSDPWAKDQQENFNTIRPILHELRMHAERALTLIAQARAAAPASKPIVYTLVDQLPANPTSLRETDAIDALELGARRFDFIGLKFQLADEMSQSYARALAASTSTDKKIRATVGTELGDINSVNGRIQDIKDEYSLIRDLYQQSWLRTNRPYALRPVLEHYDATIGLWISRMNKMRSAQRQWGELHTLPSALEAGIGPPPVEAASPAPPVAAKGKKAKKSKRSGR